jgi:hypothetical protein
MTTASDYLLVFRTRHNKNVTCNLVRVCEKTASKKLFLAQFAAYQNLKICKTEIKRRDSKSSCTESIFGRVSEQHSKT